MKTFVVDNDSSDEAIAMAIRDLKRTIRYGKLAERALKNIRETGFHDGRVCVVSKNSYTSAVIHRFPAFQQVSRADLPGWSELTVACGEIEKGSYGGSAFAKMPVYVCGQGLAHAREAGIDLSVGSLTSEVVRTKLQAGVASARIGFCRLKSSGEVTFEADSRWRHLASRVFRIKRNVEASEKTRQEAAMFARIYAHVLVNCGERYDNGREKLSQKMLDLRATVPKWLIEDKMINKMFCDMLDSIDVAKVFGT